MGKTKRSEKEVLKQVIIYADGITAFSALQSIGFVLSIASGTSLGVNVQRHLALTCFGIGVSWLVYMLLLSACRRVEVSLVQEDREQPEVARAIKTIHWVRYGIVCIATVLSVLVSASTKLK